MIQRGLLVLAAAMLANACSVKVESTKKTEVTSREEGRQAGIIVPIEPSAVSKIILKLPTENVRFQEAKKSEAMRMRIWFPNEAAEKVYKNAKQDLDVDLLKKAIAPAVILNLDQKTAVFDAAKLPWPLCDFKGPYVKNPELLYILNPWEDSDDPNRPRLYRLSQTGQATCVSAYDIRASIFGPTQIILNDKMLTGFKNLAQFKVGLQALNLGEMRDSIANTAAFELMSKKMLTEQDVIYFLQIIPERFRKDFAEKADPVIRSAGGIKAALDVMTDLEASEYVKAKPKKIVTAMPRANIADILALISDSYRYEIFEALIPHLKKPIGPTEFTRMNATLPERKRLDALELALKFELEPTQEIFRAVQDIPENRKIEAIDKLVPYVGHISNPKLFLSLIDQVRDSRRMDVLAKLMPIADLSLSSIKTDILALMPSNREQEALQLMQDW